MREDRLDAVREIVRRHEGSVWSDKGESREQWDLLVAALALVEACDDADGQLADYTHTLNELMDFYISSLRQVDQLQRECEQAVGGHLSLDGAMAEVVEQATAPLRRLDGKIAASLHQTSGDDGLATSGAACQCRRV